MGQREPPSEDVAEMVRCFRDDAVEDGRTLLRRCLSADDPQRRRAALQGLIPLADEAPDTVITTVPELCPLLADPDDEIRSRAAQLVGHLAGTAPDTLVRTAPQLTALLTDDYELVAGNALFALERLSETHPDAVTRAIPKVVQYLDAPDADDRYYAAALVSNLVSVPGTTSTLQGELQTIVTALSDRPVRIEQRDRDPHPMAIGRLNRERLRKESAREQTAAVVTSIAAAHPDRVADHLETLAPLLEDPNPALREEILATLEALAEETPGALVGAVDALATLVGTADDDDAVNRGLGLLVAVAESRPEETASALAGELEHVADALNADGPRLRGRAVGLLAHVAEQAPEQVAPMTPKLLSLLEDDQGFVRGNAALALGYLGASEARSALKELAADDGNATVREAAGEALDLLEGG